MSRIFLTLAVFAVALLAANLLIGVTLGDFGAASRAYQAASRHHKQLASKSTASLDDIEDARIAVQRTIDQLTEQHSAFRVHIWLGVSAALVTLLVSSISVTYFIGTNRWCLEVVDAFSLDRDLAERSRRLKYGAFPWSLTVVLLILAIAGLGAASDPARAKADLAADWVPYHWGLAMVGIVVISGCLLALVSLIGENYKLINEILVAAEEERERRKAAREQVAKG